MFEPKPFCFALVLGFVAGRFLRPRAPVLFYGLVGVFVWTAWDAVAEGAWHSVVLPFTAGGLVGGFFDEIKDLAGRIRASRGRRPPEHDDPSPSDEGRKSSFSYGDMSGRVPPKPKTGSPRQEPPRQEPPKPPPAPEPPPRPKSEEVPRPKPPLPPRPPPAPDVPAHLAAALAALDLPPNRKPQAGAVVDAYRAFAKRWHPDRHGGDHAYAEKFVAGTKAFDALRDAGWA